MTHHRITDQPSARTEHLSLRLSSTGRGARLARQLAVQQLTEWTGLPHDSDAARSVALITTELASNAITHGSLSGRDFRLTLRFLPESAAVRIEVTDTRPDRLPPRRPTDPVSPEATSGRGLLLVEAYATRWGCTVRDAYTKTVWAEAALHLPNASPFLRTGRTQAEARDPTYALDDVSPQPGARNAPTPRRR